MASFGGNSQVYNAFPKDHRICIHAVQLDVLMHILASQVCELDDPQYGVIILSGVPTGGTDDWIAQAGMRKGDFNLRGMSGKELAKKSINAAVNFPDIAQHYTQMASGSEELMDGVYFDESLSVLVLDANHGRLLMSIQLSYTEDGDEYIQKHLLKAYGAAVMALQYIMPKDRILQDSCTSVLEDIEQQYEECMKHEPIYEPLHGSLNWIQGVFERRKQPQIQQLSHWQEEYPEFKSYFRE